MRLNILLPNFLLDVCKICDVMLIPLLQSRLKSELKKLRKKYEKETEISKREFMHVHSKQVNRNTFMICEKKQKHNFCTDYNSANNPE